MSRSAGRCLRLLVVAPALLVALGVTGCGGEAAVLSSPTPAVVADGTPAATFAGCPDLAMNGIFEWVKFYRTLDELVADAEVVVRVRATDRVTVSETGGLPFTATEVEVVETIRGKVSAVFPVVQMGAVPAPSEPGRPARETSALRGGLDLLRPGPTYFLFLAKRTGIPGEDTAGQYVVVRTLTGLYLEESGYACHLDPESPDLPAVLPVDELRERVAG